MSLYSILFGMSPSQHVIRTLLGKERIKKLTPIQDMWLENNNKSIQIHVFIKTKNHDPKNLEDDKFLLECKTCPNNKFTSYFFSLPTDWKEILKNSGLSEGIEHLCSPFPVPIEELWKNMEEMHKVMEEMHKNPLEEWPNQEGYSLK
jgi:hypothetical protein